MDEQFEAFLQESISEEDSTKFKQIFHKTEAKPWWIEADEESDDDTGKGHNFLKSHPAGPTHSTPDDSKKKPAEDENLNFSHASKETSNKVERLSSRYAKIGEISSYQRGIRKFEGTLSKDSLEDISEKSEEDSESKRDRMQKKTLVSTETTSQMTASLIQANKQPQDELLHTGSLPLFKDNSHPGQDTLEEMMDKQKFFFDLEQNTSGTLDYGLLNQQLSNTASVININAAAQGEHSPILNSANSKEPSEITPNQQKPSLLSKVSLKDSQGSSLNTTGISTQADAEHSPVVSKEHVKDTFEDTEFVLIQKDNSGIITSQEMEDLHIALQNIDMSSALPPKVLPLPDIQRILKPAETVIKLPDKIGISENDDCAIIVANSCINKPTSHQLFKNSKSEIAARLNNQDDNSEINKTNSRHIEYLEKEVEFWKNKYEEEKQQLLQLKSHTAKIGMKQKHDLNQQKQIYENEIDSLKKSNFVLKSKISKELKEVSESEELVGLQKELSEQQVLLLGYETENERLYNEAKQLKTQYKVSEEKFFRENQKLLIELNSLKNQLEFKENLCPPQMSQQSAMTHNFSELFSKSSNGPPIFCINCGHPFIFAVSKLSQLESERQVQDVYAIVKRENSILEKTKQELESQINLLIHQKEKMRQSLQEVKNGKLEEFNVIESKLKEERDEMKKKLHWYAYNQQLLDQDIAVFKQKDKEIERLNKKIEQLQSETGRRLEENKLHSKEKSAFQNRIQDLEKQIREMERIFQKRNPNSLTTLFLAAGNLEKDMKDSPNLVVKVLEEKVKKLESELELKENMEDKSIRSVEQKYNKLKFHYEEQIENLEQQLHHFQQKSSLADHPHTHRLALENELESVRERHRTETAELQVQLNQLHAAVDKLKKDEGSLHEEMKVAQEQEKRIRAQNQVLRKQFANSNQHVIMLRASVARLKQEKKLPQQHQRATSTKQDSNTLGLPRTNKFKKNNPSSTQKRFLGNRDLAGMVKIHEEIIEENESLKTKLDHLQLTIEQQKVELYKNKAESEAALWKIQKKHKTQIDMLKLSHQQELQQILTEQTLRNSTSQIPELLSKIDAQQILINHLKEQLVNTQVDGEKLSMLTIREVVLENQVKQLTDKLEEAKKTHSPDRIHFENLVNKMQDLEKKHVAREKELQNIIKNGRKLQVSELEKEMNKWKQIAECKNQDIENYRIELDSILNILQRFQQQGLIISGNISQH